jgi:hypothetical protein
MREGRNFEGTKDGRNVAYVKGGRKKRKEARMTYLNE